MKSLMRRMRQFRDAEDGLVMTEFMFILPLLLWTYIGLFIYWDAFRTINEAQKATYSVSDLMSRQSEVNGTFIDGMQKVTEYQMNRTGISMRISSLKYKADDDKLYVLFSRSPNSAMLPLTFADVNLAAFRAKIPIMTDQDSIVVVETSVPYTPAFLGTPGVKGSMFEAKPFVNFIVTRPRYSIQVCYTGQACPTIL